jgi:predicted AlkP superfamily phosphohydrolase/phosphomutase
MAIWQKQASADSKRQVMILGLDGTPYTLLQRFMKEGVMPNLAGIVQEGSLVQMDTSIPEISSTAWTTFFTGVNPAKHGIYGFIDLKPRSYEIYFPNANHVQAKSLWERLGEHQKRSMVLNVPSTYPARPLNGLLVSGFVAIDLAKATYPSSLIPILKESGYQLDVDATKAQQSLDLFAKELSTSLESRTEVLWRLLTQESWDLFIGVITETDRMHHYLWSAVEDPASPYHDFFKSLFRRVDQWIGKVYDWFRGKGLFMIMSDHGFHKIEQEIYLNHWLREEGYLSFTQNPPQSLQEIDPKSRAFALDPSRIYIHLQGKYPAGGVLPGEEYHRLREELKEKALKLAVNGVPVVKRVYFKEEIYQGPLLETAPDLVLLPNRGFDLKGTISKRALTGRTLFTGMHTQDDAFLYSSEPILKNGKAHILDITPTTLSYLGLPIPGEIDGTILTPD